MDITYLGHSSFQASTKNAKVIMDPYDSKMIGKTFPKLEANIVTISHDHGDHNASGQIGGDPLVVTLAGEFEKDGIRVYGFETYHDPVSGAERGKNVIYKIEIEGISILHCGDLGHAIDNETLEEIENVDVLMIPVGGFFTINADEAHKIATKVEPSIIIPMHYKAEGFNPEIMEKLAPVEDFLAKFGISEYEPQKKLSVRAADMTAGEQTRVVVMQS